MTKKNGDFSMEQARFILAIVLSFIVLFVWQSMYTPIPPDNTNNKQNLEKKEATITKEEVVKNKPQPIDLKEKEDIKVKQEKDPRLVVVKTPLYIAELSEKCGSITKFFLANYKEFQGDNAPLKTIVDMPDIGSAYFNLAGASINGLDKAIFNMDYDHSVLNVNKPSYITFSWKSAQGIIVKKIYTFYSDSYLINLSVQIINQSTYTINDKIFLSIKHPITSNDKRSATIFEGPCALINGILTVIDIEEKVDYNGSFDWIAIQDRYFVSAVIPKNYKNGNIIYSQLLKNEKYELIEAAYENSNFVLGPMAKQSIEYDLFFGPKSLKLLSSFDNNLDKIIDFYGWFDVLARPLLYFMNYLYYVIPNYGFVIIIITILIKILFWPLGNKSYQSMKEMKKIQPLIMDLRNRYGHDKVKMNQEMMALYKMYKINPLSGCLPMLIQIPVFIAFYGMLNEAIELRHAPFMLWINDLSSPDRLGNFNQSIPFMNEPYGIPVLTVIMGATMFLQQKMSPPPGDPSQAKIMMFLPIFFTVIFINFPSGLVLYWLVNNVASILQQYYINKKNA